MMSHFNLSFTDQYENIVRRLLLLPFFLLATMCMNAQEERTLMPVDWQAIKKEVKENPVHVKQLVARLSGETIDRTLTFPERVLAFYGQSFLSNDAEDVYRTDMDKSFEDKKWKKCLATAKKMLDVNPLSLNALITTGEVLIQMSQDSTRWKNVKEDDARPYINRAMRIFNTIAVTGDGSAEHPFYVTKVSDEYCFMRYYLDLWKYKKQSATSCCDIITLDGNSKYYDRPEIYFEITRVYELERIMFQQ